MKVVIVALALGLGGCAEFKAGVDAVASANDSALVGAELVLCRGITIGAWVRAFGTSPEKAKAWQTLCLDKLEVLPAPQL